MVTQEACSGRAAIGSGGGYVARLRMGGGGRRKETGLPKCQNLFEAVEDAREDCGDQGVQGGGHGSATIV